MPKPLQEEKTAAEIGAEVLVDELRVRRVSLEKEAQMRLHLIGQNLERMNHNILVAEHDIKENMRNGLKKMQKVNDGIMLPEDL